MYRGEVMLLNMLIPLILHVGGGMKNIPKLREKQTYLNLIFSHLQHVVLTFSKDRPSIFLKTWKMVL